MLGLFISLLPVYSYSETMHDHSKMNMDTNNVIVIDPARLQSIGVTHEAARIQTIEKVIRTVGHVEADERKIAHIHVRFDGWIEKLFINFVGEKVKKDEALFTVYSPDLVSTEQEYLLALESKKILGKQAQDRASRGASDAFDSAKQRLLLWGVSEKEIQRLTQTGKVLKIITIDSPINGTVINKTAFAGMRIEPSGELYTIADLSSLWILGDIYEYELPYIHVGQIADVNLSYLPNESFKAKLDFIYPTVDSKTRTIKVRFQLDNQNEKFKPGMYANIELKIPLGKHLVVPKDAVLLTGERAVVFIYQGDGKIQWRNVTLGIRAGNVIEIKKGIHEGEQVITSANFLIDSESQLKAAMGGMQH
jgi:Cu(I)/Ag(I) efflux system membrane fusion protein